MHSVEKIGGTSMSNYAVIRDNIFLNPAKKESLYQRIFVVSAYAGVTNKLLEHKKDGTAGIFALFSSGIEDNAWITAFHDVQKFMMNINESLFDNSEDLQEASQFLNERLDSAKNCLLDLKSLCRHGHFSLENHLNTVREILASVGEAHSAWNTVKLLKSEGINARFIDLSGWGSAKYQSLDENIVSAFEQIDLSKELPIVTGYAHCEDGLMNRFDRGYSEMTFSRIAVLTKAEEAIIHKEFHLSSADPKVVGEAQVIPIGRTNYDVADQLANLGMEAIHPNAAKGLRQNNIPLRVKNAFEPEHKGTLITRDYISSTPCVEIIAGRRNVYALELFDQNMAGRIASYDTEILNILNRFKAHIIAKDINANTVTHYVSSNLKNIKRIQRELEIQFADAEINQRKVAIVSAIGSDMEVPGILAQTVKALAENNICVLAMHQSMRQVDMQFIIQEKDYELAIRSLHNCLIEPYDHGSAICLAV